MHSTEPIRLGVAGLHHDHVWRLLEAAAAHPGFEIVAASDPYPRLRERFAAEYRLPVHERYDPVLGDPALDAFLICADNRTSAELAVAASALGKHVLVEKPMAADLDGARRMLETSRSHGTVLMINWPYAWWPALRHGLRLAREGTLGRIWHVRYRGCHRGPENVGCSPEFTGWLFDPARNGGGALMDYCCYGANLAGLLLEHPQSVTGFTATVTRRDFPVEDNATLIVRYPEAMATLEASWSETGHLTAYRTVIQGTEGTFLIEPHGGGRLIHATDESPEGVLIEVPELDPEDSEPMAHFHAAVRHGAALHPLCAPETGFQAQRILEAGARAAWEHQESAVPE